VSFQKRTHTTGGWRAVAQQTSGKWQVASGKWQVARQGTAGNRDRSDTGVKAKHLGFTVREAV